MNPLRRLFAPKSLAVIGASETAGKVGTIVLQNLVQAGFEGPIFAINRRRDVVQGRRAFSNITQCGQQIDLAIVCTPFDSIPKVIAECGDAQVGGLIVITAGFREAGGAGRAAEVQIAEVLVRFPNMRLLGPNCLGAIVPHAKLNASFASSMPQPGRLAFASQSGALCTAILDWAADERIGFSHFISMGNMLDVHFGDVLDYFADDPSTDAVLLYVESVTNARSFMSAARACSFRKPVIAYKAGRFAASAQAAASHTGAMAGVDSVYEAALQRAGIVRVQDMNELFDSAEVLARGIQIRGDRLAIVTNAGGPGVMASDALIARGYRLATLASSTLAELNELLPAGWPHGNPVDVLGDAQPARFGAALKAVLDDPGVDGVIAIVTPQAMTNPAGTAQSVIEAAKNSETPVIATWMGGHSMEEGIRLLNEAGIPTARTPNEAVAGFASLIQHARNRELLYETPHEISLTFPPECAQLRGPLVVGEFEHDLLSEAQAKHILSAYGIPVAEPVPATSATEAAAIAKRIGFPVVLKVVSPQIAHKTDIGGVELNLTDEQQVELAYQRITKAVHEKRPDASIDTITVQPMVTQPSGLELLLGLKTDPIFGPVIMVGLGGVAAEVLRDTAVGLPPLNDRLATRMLESLRSWPLISGYRGREPIAQTDSLVDLLLRFSQLAADLPQIRELDANPILVRDKHYIALDARVLIDRKILHEPKRKAYSHLAIRPYPVELVRRVTLRDGAPLVLRPIKPEDEPLWQAYMARCSIDSFWSRFGYMFRFDSHDMATRFCFVDYDREFTMVAERGSGRDRQLVGVARIVEERGTGRAEFAELIDDQWQNRGLGKLLAESCIESVDRDRVHTIYAETARTNMKMVHVLQDLGFELAPAEEGTLARGTKQL